MTHYAVPYGDSEMQFEIPYGADVADTILPERAAAELYVPKLDTGDCSRALIIFTDATRHSPDRWFVDKILAALPLPPENIEFMCALGMHRPSTRAEKIEKLGQDIIERYSVIDHDPAAVVTVGEIDGIPVEVHPKLVEPGTFLIMTGVVEPHQYAGYSGGAETAVIGCGGTTTISLTHGPVMLNREGVRLGVIDGNPFQQFVRKAGEMIGVNLVANAVMPAPELITHAAVGDVSVHDALVAEARKLYETPVPNAPYDIVVAGVGAPKDVNLYQASRAATYIGLSGTPVLREGGVLIVPATLPEGAGEGAGEKNFFEVLRRFKPTPALIEYLNEKGCRPGEQRAYMIALMEAKYTCIMVGAENPSVVTDTGLHHAESVSTALEAAARLLKIRQPKVLIVPHALKTLPAPTQ